jgi:hypothetical protein
VTSLPHAQLVGDGVDAAGHNVAGVGEAGGSAGLARELRGAWASPELGL